MYIKLRPVFSLPQALTRPSSLASVIPVDCYKSSLTALRICSCPPAHYLPYGCQNALLQICISCHIIHIKTLVGLNCPLCNYKTPQSGTHGPSLYDVWNLIFPCCSSLVFQQFFKRVKIILISRSCSMLPPLTEHCFLPLFIY